MQLSSHNFKVWLLSQIHQLFQRNEILQKFIFISHALWILVFLLNSEILKSCAEKQICSTLIGLIQNQIFAKIVCLKTLIAVASSMGILGLQIIIIGRFSTIRVDLHGDNKLLELLIYFTVINYIFTQIAIFPVLYYVFQNSDLNSMQQIGIFSAIVLCYYRLNSILPKNSLYEKPTFLILILVITSSNWIAQLVVSLITVYQLTISLEKVRRILFKIILVVSLKTIWLKKTSEGYQLISISAGIYYGVIFLITFIFVLCFGYQLKFISDQHTFYSIFIKTKQIQSNTHLKDSLTFNQILDFFAFFQTQAKKCGLQLMQKMEKQLNSDITIENFHQIHLTLLMHVYKKHQLSLYSILILELKMLTKKSLIKILAFKNSPNFKIYEMSWYQQIILYETQQKLIYNYGEFNQKSQLKVNQMLKNYRKIQDFKTHFNSFIRFQINFWANVLRPKIIMEDLFSDFEKIQQIRLKLKQKDNQLLKSKIFDDIQLLFQEQQFTIFQYQCFYENQSAMKRKKSIRKSKDQLTLRNVDEIELLEQVSENFFLIVSDDRVSFMSDSLANELKKHLKIGYEMQEIFGPYFSDFLKIKISQINTKNKNEWIPLPLFVDKFNFLLSNAMIFWLPSIDNKATFFIKISLMISEPYLIYDTCKNLVKFYNHNFISQFDLSEKFVKMEIERQELRFQRLFLSSFQEFFPYLELNNSHHHTEFEPQNYIGQKDKINIHGLVNEEIQLTLESLPIVAQVWEWININSGKLVIMSVQKIAIQGTQKTSNSSSGMQRTLTKINHKNIFEHDKNNYASEINQAFSMIKQGKISKRVAISLAFILILTGVSLTSNILDSNLFSDRMSLYNSKIEEIELGSDCFILLYRMYKRASKNYQYLTYPQNVVQNLGVSLESAIQGVKDSERIFLNTFVPQYLQSMQFKPKTISYNLNFQQFNITTSTDAPTLMDFAQNFLRNIEFNQYDFILQNYLSMRQLVTNFQQISNIQVAIQQSSWEIHLQNLIFISVIIALVIVLFFVELKNRLNIRKLVKIYCLFSNKQIIKKIKKLQAYIEAFQDEVKYINADENEITPLLNKFQNTPEVPEQSQSLENLEFPKTLNSPEVTETPEIAEIFETPKASEEKKFEGKIFEISNFRKITKFLMYLLISGIFFSISTVQYLASDREMKLAKQIIDYHELIYKTLIEMNRINTDTGLAPVFRHKFGKQLNLNDAIVQINDRLQIASDFQEMKEINTKMLSLMEGDMCQFPFSNGVEMIPCQDYEGGLLTRGYSQSYNTMVELSKIVQSLQLSEFNTENCTLSYCPPYFVFDEISLRINSMFQVILTVFSSMQINYFTKFQANQKIIFWIKNAILTIGILTLIFQISREVKRSTKALRLFIYIPTKIINSKKVTSFLKKENTINDLNEF